MREEKQVVNLLQVFVLLFTVALTVRGETTPSSRPSTSTVTQTFKSSDGRTMQVFDESRLVFYETGERSKVVSEVDVRELRITPSANSTVLALGSRFVDKKSPIYIYGSDGKKRSAFDGSLEWAVESVSDDGKLLVLLAKSGDEAAYRARLVDSSGKVVADPAGAGILLPKHGALIYGMAGRPARIRLQLLSADGAEIDSFEYGAEGQRIYDAAVTSAASKVVIAEGPTGESFPSSLTVWDRSNANKKSVAIPKQYGELQPAMCFSPSGRFLAIRLGATGVGVVDIDAVRILHTRDLKMGELEAKQTSKVLAAQVDDEGAVTARCLLADASIRETKITNDQRSPRTERKD